MRKRLCLLTAPPANTVAERHSCEQIVSHQLIFGSYPSAYLTDSHNEKIMILSDLAEALILRDASDLFRIRRVDAFRKLLMLLESLSIFQRLLHSAMRMWELSVRTSKFWKKAIL
ncbi:MAG: hypothetical protein BWK80_26730 [Desulfobacteraceae bacterium IS3]|nr:MAG: hypothetical protein BWK80_26730 [Desulfobacteraceae bacterium IS3]HAO22894.1 hypothetical protein [Desulfobacteraceae bacterium]